MNSPIISLSDISLPPSIITDHKKPGIAHRVTQEARENQYIENHSLTPRSSDNDYRGYLSECSDYSSSSDYSPIFTQALPAPVPPMNSFSASKNTNKIRKLLLSFLKDESFHSYEGLSPNQYKERAQTDNLSNSYNIFSSDFRISEELDYQGKSQDLNDQQGF